jgi:uncharacterized protein YyaL (SSP411 family)
MQTKKANNLIKQKSPYLQQHAYNPVDWFAWENEAFEKAAKEDKPIFLSIGYSTCHWCHVMEKESFEDEEVAGLMNNTFISIKVDREERPDIDNIYMLVCQMLTGSGGWPLTIIMTPDKKPFFAGTYFPKEDRFGRMGMLSLVKKIDTIWKNNRDQILKSADEITAIVESSGKNSAANELDTTIFDNAFGEFSKRFDEDFGGFGTAPKFPTPHNLSFLLRYFKRKKDKTALMMVEKTLLEMRKGGIHDHIGFGFHRYSTDRRWFVPHFEKMLYDQALLVNAYRETFLITHNTFYKETAEEILQYVLRDMTSEQGGFYSAEDADSEDEEGKFYLWTYKEIKEILTEDEFKLFTDAYNVSLKGNWLEENQTGENQTNILNITKNLSGLSKEFEIGEDELKLKLESSRKKLFHEREKRVHPFKDDKILTDWNSLMISAFAKSYQAFGKKIYKEAAEKSAKFITENLINSDGGMLHRFRNDEASIKGNIDDYAFFIAALLDLYESTFKTDYLNLAFKLNKDMIYLFQDEKDGGFYFTGSDSEKLLIRQKEIYDGAIPSGNSIALLNLLRISRFTGDTLYENLASQLSKAFSGIVYNSPSGFTQFLSSLDFAYGPSNEIIIASNKNADEVNSFTDLINMKFLPNKILILANEEIKRKITSMDYLKNYNMKNGKTTVYICENFKCEEPITDLSELEKYLSGI